MKYLSLLLALVMMLAIPLQFTACRLLPHDEGILPQINGEIGLAEESSSPSVTSATKPTDTTIEIEYDKGELENMMTPEKYGISSNDIAAILEGYRKAGLSMHGMVVMRHGEVVAEAYAEPFDADTLHRMYSVSKSFVSLAIGALEADGLISINDTIDRFFPDYVNENTDPRIAKTKIVDLLRMASPFRKGSTYKGKTDMNWVETFFVAPVGKEPGTEYLYDTSATYILDVIVERVTGKPFLEYLKDKALREIGFSEDAWCVKAPEGYSWGGSGVMCTPRDLAAVANLVMNKGVYNGKQLLPADYLEQATKKQIETAAVEGDSEYYGMGYGYQIWINPYGFSFMGMGNQHAFCIPELDLVFVCTADNQGNSSAVETIYRLMVDHLIKKISDEPLPEDPAAYAKLQAEIDGMSIPYQKGLATSARADAVNGKTFVCTGSSDISSFRLDFNGDVGVLTYVTSRGEKQLTFGIGKNVACILDEPQYSGELINHPNGKGYRSYCSGAWTNATTFALKVQVVDDYLGNMTMTFDLDSNPSLTVTKTAEWFLDEYKMSNVSYRMQ